MKNFAILIMALLAGIFSAAIWAQNDAQNINIPETHWNYDAINVTADPPKVEITEVRLSKYQAAMALARVCKLIDFDANNLTDEELMQKAIELRSSLEINDEQRESMLNVLTELIDKNGGELNNYTILLLELLKTEEPAESNSDE